MCSAKVSTPALAGEHRAGGYDRSANPADGSIGGCRRATYFARCRRPLVPAALLQHLCIQARLGTGKLHRWEFEKHGQVVLIDAPGALTLDEPGLMLEAALASAGLAYIGEASAAEQITAARPEVVLRDWTPPPSRPLVLFR